MFAVARTLVNHPDLNANMVGDNVIRHFKHVHLGMAVDTPRGLMVPTIHDADTKSLLEISMEAKALAAEARDLSLIHISKVKIYILAKGDSQADCADKIARYVSWGQKLAQ